ncbi:MAG: hypothetical protein ACK4NV_17645, partial [Pannonibacter sp.]
CWRALCRRGTCLTGRATFCLFRATNSYGHPEFQLSRARQIAPAHHMPSLPLAPPVLLRHIASMPIPLVEFRPRYLYDPDCRCRPGMKGNGMDAMVERWHDEK